jgi:drug/metabolite transporter (DMT)-like permease
VILFVGPLLAVTFSGYFLKEHVTPGKFIAVLFGFAGIVVALRPGAADFNLYSLLVLAAALLFAANGIFNRLLARNDRALTLAYYPTTILVAIFTLPALLNFKPMPMDMLLRALLAGVFVGAAMLCNANAYRRAPIYLIAPCQFLQFLWGSLAQYILYHRWPMKTSLIGAAMIIGSNLVLLYLQYRQKKTSVLQGSAS